MPVKYRVEGRDLSNPDFNQTNIRNMESGRFDAEQSKKLVKNIKAALDPETKRTNEAIRQIAEQLSNNTRAFQEAAENWSKQDMKNAKAYITEASKNKSGFKARLQRESLAAAAPEGTPTDNDLKDTGIFAAGANLKKSAGRIKEGFSGGFGKGIKSIGSEIDKGATAAFTSAGNFFKNQLGPGAFGSSGFLGLGTTAEGKKAAAARRAGVDTLKGEGATATEAVIETVTDLAAMKDEEVATEKAEASKEKTDKKAEASKERTDKKAEASKERTGVDRESPETKQTELLEDILKELKTISASVEGGMMRGSDDGLDLDLDMFGRDNERRGSRTKPRRRGRFGRMSRMFQRSSKLGGGILSKSTRALGTASRGLARFGGPALVAGLSVYEGVSDFNSAESMANAGELDAQQEQEAKVKAVTEATGSFGGATAGAVAGAAIGSVIPVVGTVIGGVIGGALGYFAGKKAGEMAGGVLADSLDIDEGLLAESNAQAEAMMKNIEERDPELAGKIRAAADEFVQNTLALPENEGKEWSKNDQEVIQNSGLVAALQAYDGEIQAAGVDRAAVMEVVKIETEAGFESAKESGLYDEDFFGNSEIDKSKLGDATEAELRAIIQDNDLSESDMEAVKVEYDFRMNGDMESLPSVSSASEIEREVFPTSNAVENMTEAAQTQQIASAAPVVNNITNNTTNPTNNPVLINPATSRSTSSSLQRFQDIRFAV